MATGIPDLSWINDGAYSIMPGRMRLDSFEASWERASANDSRLSITTEMPRKTTVYSGTIDTTQISDPDSYKFTFVVTIPKLSIDTFASGSIVANLQGQNSGSPGWATVYTANTTATDKDPAGGIQRSEERRVGKEC